MKELTLCEMHLVSGGDGPGDSWYDLGDPCGCPYCEKYYEEKAARDNSPALVGAGFGNGAYSSAFYNEKTNKKSPINEAIINGINKASDFFNDFNKAVSGPPTK